MKKLLLILTMLLPLVANAYDAYINGIYYNFSGDEAIVTNGASDNSYTGAVDIPEHVPFKGNVYTVTTIGNNAFGNCSGLISIAFPSSVKRVMSGAFSGCSSLNKVIVTDIAAWCSITYEGSNYQNGDFPLCMALHLYSDENTEITEVIIPDGVTRIEPLAFRDAKYITSVTIPESVTNIGAQAFRGMHSLTSINLPQGISSIEPYTFQDCESLASITIPNGVTKIGDYAFSKCYALADVYCYALHAPNAGNNTFNHLDLATVTLNVPAGSVKSYRTTSPWSDFGVINAIRNDTISYSINSAQDLVAFANVVNMGSTYANAVLTADIDLSEISSTWTPIGNVDNPYTGTFDGQNHKLTGFTMNIVSGNNQGLFGYTADATIENFSIAGSINYYGGTGVGVIGWAEGTIIHNVHSALNISIVASDSHHIGGICGSLRVGTTASNCSFSGTITDTANNIDCLGGIGGYSNQYCLYENCANYGTITFSAPDAYAGGICGYVNNNNFYGIKNCLNVGKVHVNSGKPTYSGAIVGRLRSHSNSEFENNYWLDSSAVRTSGDQSINATAVTFEQLVGGGICYALNVGQSQINWYQTLGMDNYPVLNNNHRKVYFDSKAGVFTNLDPDSKKGDVNEDGDITIADGVAVLNAMAGQTVSGNPDVNEDGEVTIADFVAVLNIMAGQ
ncbi:MAG: leucine-rich repeat protein [Pseudobutyrivibrio sp.]|nr:leucine-rich repeat protein [Pseudobutyrivibrio sp.]